VIMPTGKHHYDGLKNLMETRNLKWIIFWYINIIYFDVYISKFM
jgi:hypothetical protein